MDTIDQVDKIGLLLDFASKGNVESIQRLLDEGLPVDSVDYDWRTAMHLAASEGHYEVIECLLQNKAQVNLVDRWRKTPLADARWYAHHWKMKNRTESENQLKKVCSLLLAHGGITSSPFEIDPDELKFHGEPTCQISEGSQLPESLRERLLLKSSIVSEALNIVPGWQFALGKVQLANWRGTDVSARIVEKTAPSTSPSSDSQVVKQLSLLQSCRHPNIVQFLGAATDYERQDKSKALVLITENLPNGNLFELLHRKNGRIQPKDAVNYALDIARGMNYLHEHKPEAIVHCELNSVNLLRDAAGQLKVSGIGLSKLIGCVRSQEYTAIKKKLYNLDAYGHHFDFSKYECPEYQETRIPARSVDVYSFGVIVHEMFEGPILATRHSQVAEANRSGRDAFSLRTSFPPNSRTSIPPNLRELLDECRDPNPNKRPEFRKIICRLETINQTIMKKTWWAPKPMLKFMTNVTDKYTQCVHVYKNSRFYGGSITPRYDASTQGIKHRRGRPMTNCTLMKEGEGKTLRA